MSDDSKEQGQMEPQDGTIEWHKARLDYHQTMNRAFVVASLITRPNDPEIEKLDAEAEYHAQWIQYHSEKIRKLENL